MGLNIKLLKLITMEDIIAEVIPSIDTEYNTIDNILTLKNPIRVMVVPSKTDPKTPTVGFAPYLEFSSEKTFTIDKSHVLVITTPIQEFINQYQSIFSGLLVAKSNLIIP
jgi:hypothetical protein